MKKALWNAFLRTVPGGWRLPIQYWRSRITGYVDPEMSLIRRWRNPEQIAIDIGANHGIYAFELSRWFQKVEAFEPNQRISSEIRAYDQSRMTLHSVALSAADGQATFHVPISPQGAELVGWGTLDPQLLAGSPHFSQPPQFQEFGVITRTLDSFEFDRVGFIKVDVEGHEKEVLSGSRKTIERCRPVLLVEVRFDSRAAVLEFFTTLDYRMFFLRGTTLSELGKSGRRPEEAQENFFAIPFEKEAAAAG